MANRFPVLPQGDPLNTGYEVNLQGVIKYALRLNMDSRSSALIGIVDFIEGGSSVSDSLNLHRAAARFVRYEGIDTQRSIVDWLSMLLSAEQTSESAIALANLRCELYVNSTLPQGARYVVLSHQVDGVEKSSLHIFPNPASENATMQLVLSQIGSAVELGPDRFLSGLDGEGDVVAYYITSPTL